VSTTFGGMGIQVLEFGINRKNDEEDGSHRAEGHQYHQHASPPTCRDGRWLHAIRLLAATKSSV